MILKILTQNALDGFSDVHTTQELVQLVRAQDPDVAIFPEAYDGREPYSEKLTEGGFEAMEYEVLHGLYGDRDERKDGHGIVMLVRRKLMAPDRISRLVYIGERRVAEVWVRDPQTDQRAQIIGLHLDDRSEGARQHELDDLLEGVVDAEHPVIVAGDLNGIHKREAHGLIFLFARMLALLVDIHVLPVRQTIDARHPPKGFGRIGSLVERLREMASGQTVARFEQAGFTDADTKHQSTHPASRPLAQLDHIMVRGTSEVAHFRVLPRNLSDHRGIVAEIKL